MDEQTKGYMDVIKQTEDIESIPDAIVVSNGKQKKHGMLAFRLARGDKKNITALKKYYRTNSASQAIRLCLEDKVKGIKSNPTGG